MKAILNKKTSLKKIYNEFLRNFRNGKDKNLDNDSNFFIY
jgi:hypothetical protein